MRCSPPPRSCSRSTASPPTCARLCESLGITEIPVPLLASGDAQLDDAAVETGVATQQAVPQPDKGPKPDKGDKGPATTDPGTQTGGTQTTPTDPLQLPTQGTNGNNGNGNGNNNPQNPLGTGLSVPTALPSVGIPEVDQVVEDVVEGVNGVVGGLTGAGS